MPDPRRLRVTTRGWALLSAVAVLLATGVLVGIEELIALAAAAAVLVAASTVLTASRRWDLASRRRLSITRMPVGADATVEITVANRGKSRSPRLLARDNIKHPAGGISGDKGRRSAVRFGVSSLPPGQQDNGEYRITAHRRGRYVIGPLELQLEDPFGMVRIIKRDERTMTLMAHPMIEDLLGLPGPGMSSRTGQSGSPLLGALSDELFALRPYRAGDDLRRVHWASSARFDELMIRTDQLTWNPQLMVVVDLREELHDTDSLEAVLSAAASIATTAWKASTPVRVVGARLDTAAASVAGEDHGSGGTHMAILDMLAAAEPCSKQDPSTDIPSLIKREGDSTLVVITTDRVETAEIAAVNDLCQSRHPTTVLFGTSSQGGAPDSLCGIAKDLVWVPAGGSFAASWATTVLAPTTPLSATPSQGAG